MPVTAIESHVRPDLTAPVIFCGVQAAAVMLNNMPAAI